MKICKKNKSKPVNINLGEYWTPVPSPAPDDMCYQCNDPSSCGEFMPCCNKDSTYNYGTTHK